MEVYCAIIGYVGEDVPYRGYFLKNVSFMEKCSLAGILYGGWGDFEKIRGKNFG